MCGIDLEISKRSTALKLFKYLYIFSIHFYFIYFLYNGRFLIEISKSLFYQNVIGLFFSTVVWYLMKCKIENLRKLIFKMKSMKLHKEFESFELKIVNCTNVIIILLPIIFVVIDTYYNQNSEKLHKEMVIFNIVIESKIKKILLRSYLKSAYFISIYQFPMIATLFCCLLYYQLGASISHSCKEINLQTKKTLRVHKNFTCEHVIHFFHKFSRLIDISNKLDEIVSPISFYLLSLYMAHLFTIVTSLVEISFSNMGILSILEFVAALFISLTGISSVILFASLIQKRFLDIQRSLIYMHEMYIHFAHKDNFTLELIRYMISTKTPVMTAWSVAALTPSLIFTVISVCLTFGLLSTQILQ